MARGDLTDAQWELVRPHLPVSAIGRLPRNLRTQFDGVLFHFRTGSQWRDLPERYGPWSTVYKRFAAWRDAGVFHALMTALIARAAAAGITDLSLVAVDSVTVRAHQHASGMAASDQVVEALVAAAAEEKGARPTQLANIYRRLLVAQATSPTQAARATLRNARAAATRAGGARPEPPSPFSDAPAAD